MEKRFPESKRTYTKLKDIELCGADINIAHVRMATEHLDMWESLIGTRKSPLRQAGIIGLGTLFRVLTRRITLDELVAVVSERIGIQGRVIRWEHAEPCMDVDKPHQLELLRADLAKEQRKAARKKSESKSAKAGKTGKARAGSGAKKVAAFAAARTLVKKKATSKPK
jgi:hypothetical protein